MDDNFKNNKGGTLIKKTKGYMKLQCGGYILYYCHLKMNVSLSTQYQQCRKYVSLTLLEAVCGLRCMALHYVFRKNQISVCGNAKTLRSRGNKKKTVCHSSCSPGQVNGDQHTTQHFEKLDKTSLTQLQVAAVVNFYQIRTMPGKENIKFKCNKTITPCIAR